MNGLTQTAAAGPLLVALGLAVLAGLVSFASPCVVPLVPGYLSYLAAAVGADGAGARRWRVVGSALLFVAGFTVVHAGVHPSGDLASTTFRMAITMRRFPDEDVSPHWADQYVGERRVIYGHDAVRGLIRRERDGRPWVVGLDSGCVYGGALTGYIPEEDGLVSVAAARVYKPIG